MNTPPLLLGSALLFWGWQTGYFAVGAVLAVLIELPRIVTARWLFTQPDLDRLWNLCAFIFLGAGLFLVVNEGSISWNDLLLDAGRRPEAIREKGRAALLWFQWFPMMFYPFAIAVAFSENPFVDPSTFSWFVRRRHRPARRRVSSPATDLPPINVAYPYFAITLFATCASNQRTPWFYIALCSIVAWALWARRSRRFSAWVWVVSFSLVATAGFFSHRGIIRLDKALEEMNVLWFSRFASLALDATRARTAIGAIGRLKLSDTIILRVRTDGQAPPSLLREASYTSYQTTPRAASWSSTPIESRPPRKDLKKDFTRVLEDTNGTWLLLPHKQSRRSVTIGQYLHDGRGVLALPLGVSRVDQLRDVSLERSPLGILRVADGPGVVQFTAWYDGGDTIDQPPSGSADPSTMDASEPAVDQVASELGLHPEMDPREAMRIVERYFRNNFSYTSYLSAEHTATASESALARFLLRQKTGHCEYFATASALLLRKAGVPTRYAVGYAVHEGKAKNYVVREHDAHAWTLVYHNGTWHDFDTTPDSWQSVDGASASRFRLIKDFFSDLWFQFSKWRWSGSDWRKYLLWSPIPLVLMALASFFLKKEWRKLHTAGASLRHRRDWPGADSELYSIERALARRGLARQPAESWPAWLARVRAQTSNPGALAPLIALHTKYRFDPEGLTTAERESLRNEARAYTRALKQRE